MKKTLEMIVFILPLFYLASCGGGGTSATLQVSSSFQVANTGFTGGLVISGKSNNGQVFTKYVTSGLAISLNLPKAIWEFTAVGWDGSSSLQGQTYCGNITYNLIQDKEAVVINANQTNCGNALFNVTDGTAYDSTNLTFYPLQILTCKALYKSKSSPSIVDMLTPNSFCSTLDKDYAQYASSARVTLLEKTIEGTFQPTSITSCVPESSGAMNFAFNLPGRIVPIKVEVYSNTTCAGDPKYGYAMINGLNYNYANFDKVVTGNSANTRVFLPYNDLRKGWTPFYTFLPNIGCGTGGLSDCVAQPSSLPSAGLMYLNGDGQDQLFRVGDSNTKCSDVSAISTTEIDFDSCEEQNDGVFLKLKLAAGQNCDSGSCSFGYTILGQSLSLTITTDPNDRDDVNLYNSIWRLVGNTQAPHTIFNFYDDKDQVYGRISDARQMLGPDGAGGVFGDLTCSELTAGLQRDLTVFEDGEYHQYRATIASATKAIPTYLCEDSNSDINTCASNPVFDKKIVVSQLKGPIYVPFEVVYVNCATKIGLDERQKSDIDGTETRTEKSLLAWNTNDASYSRFEYLNSEKIEDSSTVKLVRTSYERAEKFNSISDFTTFSTSYESRLNGSLYDERIQKSESFLDTPTSYLSSYSTFLEANQTSQFDIFSRVKEFNTAFTNFSALKPSSYAENSNGDIVVLWTKKISSITQLYMSRYIAATKTWTHPLSDADTISGTTDVQSASVSLSDNGNILIGFNALNPSTVSVFKIATTINSGTIPVATVVSNLSGATGAMFVSTCSLGTNSAIVWSQIVGSTGLVFVSYSLDSQVTWTSPTSTADSITSSSYSSYTKCAFSNDSLVLAWLDTSSPNNYLAMHTYDSLGSISFTTLNSHTDTNPLSGTIVTDIFLTQNTDQSVGLWAPTTSGTRYKSTFTSATWFSPQSDSVVIQKNNYCRLTSSSFGTTQSACSTPPASLKIPGGNSSFKFFMLGTSHLDPLTIDPTFTTPTLFQNQ